MTDNSNNSSNNTNNNFLERNQQVLNDISQLQKEEKSIYDKLNDVSLTPDEKKQLINKINEISQMRLNIYSNMNDMYSYYQKNVEASRTTLGQEVAAIDIIENELNEAKKRLNEMEEKKNNELRLVEINTYYGKKYNAHTNIMKTIVLFCIPVIILAFLANIGFLPPKLYMFLAGIVIIICCIIIGYQLIDLSNRDNMNWDEYNWYFDRSKAPTDTVETSNTSSNPWLTGSITCIGSECCFTGSTYDANKNMCVPNDILQTESTTNSSGSSNINTTNNNVTTESFISGKVLGKYGFIQEKSVPIYDMINIPYASLSNFR
jgi:tetrahydromethanopterin S-methyltransferase subunit G